MFIHGISGSGFLSHVCGRRNAAHEVKTLLRAAAKNLPLRYDHQMDFTLRENKNSQDFPMQRKQLPCSIIYGVKTLRAPYFFLTH
jgi:hypothetical protein